MRGLAVAALRDHGALVNGADEVWAAGQAGDVARRRAGAWTRLDLGIDAPILAIDGTGPDDVWVLTSDHLFHVDGASVIEVPVTCRLGAHNRAEMRSLSALAVAGSGDVFVTGEQFIEGFPGLTGGTCRFDGEAWHPIEFDAEVSPWGVCGLGSCWDAWSVGADQVWCGRDGLWDGDALRRVEAHPPRPSTTCGAAVPRTSGSRVTPSGAGTARPGATPGSPACGPSMGPRPTTSGPSVRTCCTGTGSCGP